MLMFDGHKQDQNFSGTNFGNVLPLDVLLKGLCKLLMTVIENRFSATARCKSCPVVLFNAFDSSGILANTRND